MSCHRYTPEEIEFLKDNVKGISLKKLTDKFNKKFSCNVSQSAITNQKVKYNLKSGVNSSRFKKGHIPYNKGTQGLKKANSGSFKKGQLPANIKDIGSERQIHQGFVIVKVANPKKWRMKHHIIYEKYHNVKIGRWDKVIFLDGNKRNFDINNLKLISNSEQIIISNRNYKSSNPDVMNSYISLAKVLNKINKIKKSK